MSEQYEYPPPPPQETGEWDGEERRVIRDPEGMKQGFVTKFRRIANLSYVEDPQSLPPIPDGYFRDIDTAKFKSECHQALIEALEVAKPHQVEILKATNLEIHKQLEEHPTVQQLKELLGPNVMRIGKALEWYVGLCAGKVPSRVTPQYLHYIRDMALQVAENLLVQLTDEKYAVQLEKAFRSVCNLGSVDDEQWEKLKDLHGPEFMQELYKYLGAHINFQGLMHDELGRIEFKDLQDVSRYLLGAGQVKKSSKGDGIWGMIAQLTESRWLSGKQQRRELDKLEPCLMLAFNRGLFPGQSGEDQLTKLEQLNIEAGGDYLDSQGVAQMFVWAEQTSTVEPRELAEKIGSETIRIALQKPHSGDTVFCEVKYDRAKGHKKRKLQWDRGGEGLPDKKIGLACGKIFPLEV
jgi:hypothetical protein